MIAGTKLHLGHAHRGKVVTIDLEETQFRILLPRPGTGDPPPNNRSGPPR
jgi:hypothetical protein